MEAGVNIRAGHVSKQLFRDTPNTAQCVQAALHYNINDNPVRMSVRHKQDLTRDARCTMPAGDTLATKLQSSRVPVQYSLRLGH